MFCQFTLSISMYMEWAFFADMTRKIRANWLGADEP